jgi:homoserine O-acetyltransferase
MQTKPLTHRHRDFLAAPCGSPPSRITRLAVCAAISLLLACSELSPAAEYPAPAEGDYVIRSFQFQSGETLPEVRMHYRTFGSPRRDENGTTRNAVLILHGTTGSSAQFLRPEFAGELFGQGQLLDATHCFIVIPDNLGHGQSSKPSDGLHARFPKYGYRDMLEAQRRLLAEGLQINHLRLVMGTSMGGMHTWLWGQMYPDFMDALMPLASLPAQIAGRNRVWRRLIIDAIRTDPEWCDGDYETQPRGLRIAVEMSYFMGNNPVQRLEESPTLAAADEALDRHVAERLPALDANDYLYAFEASRDYDPSPGLERIKAPLLAVNFADDLINPPELGVLEREIKRVKRGQALVIPVSDQTRGHGTHTLAPVWKEQLEKLLNQTEAQGASGAPAEFRVRLETSKGDMIVEVQRAWSPHGADRFYELVRAGYYDDSRFFRVKQGCWAQFGINGDPRLANAWREKAIPDDPRVLSNQRGTIAFAFAIPHGRTTQVFINLKDNSTTHDAEPFVPFGKIVSGLESADALYAGYGESAGGGLRGGKQSPLFESGNAYLQKNFPRLDFIRRATVMDADAPAVLTNEPRTSTMPDKPS